MTLPVGVPTVAITAGPYLAPDGSVVQAALRITLDRRLVHTTSGAVLEPGVIAMAVPQADGSLVVNVPPVDAPGFTTTAGQAITMWSYVATVTKVGGQNVDRTVQPLAAQTVTDLDLIPATAEVVDPVTGSLQAFADALDPYLPPVTPAEVAATLADPLVADELSNSQAYLRPHGGKFIAAGDSNTADGYADLNQLDSLAAHTMVASGGRAWHPSNAGVGGNNAAQLLARLDADVIAQAPDWCHVMIGTNDAGSAGTYTSVASYAATVTEIVTRLHAAGIFVVWSLIPPRGTGIDDVGGTVGVPRQRYVAAYNAFLRGFLPTVGVPIVDAYALLVDPATGGLQTQYDFGDGLHLNSPALKALGQAVWAAAAPHLSAAASTRARDSKDPTDLLGGAGLFLTNTSGLGAGWIDADSGHDTLSIVSGVADIAGGKMQRIAATGDVGYVVGVVAYVNSGYSPGDILEFTATFSTTKAAGHGATILLGMPEASRNYQFRIEETVIKGVWRYRVTVPSGVTYMTLKLASGPSAGTADFGEVRVQNLSRTTTLPAA